MNKDQKRNEFILRLGFDSSAIEAVRGDLSNKQFFRIKDSNRSYILMQVDPAEEVYDSFLQLTGFLLQNGFSVPGIHGSDPSGFILMDDFGIKKISDLLASKETLPDEVDEEKIYKRAADVLLKLHHIEPLNSLQELTAEKYLSDSRKFITYYAEVLNGETLSESLKQEFDEIVLHLLSKAQELFPPVITLRDYHADNLFWLFERSGIGKLGMIDYQDAILGSPAYDLVSILQDARRDVSSDLESKIVTHYLKNRPEIERRDFLTAYYIYGAQRNLKIIGQFAYYAEQMGQTHLLHLLPRVIGHLRNDLKHPVLLPLNEWLEKAIPHKGVISALTYGSGRTKIIV
jgi:aminoglycoside/choline kinase family phosphotransferase